ncbi:MAG: hypothetical protein H7Z42_13015 [Roseiflexaceae bacterium]|nr:hypothetical protein [Roseiflexaceae bacterium]
MKWFWRILGLSALVGFAVIVVRAIQQYREDSVFDLSPAGATAGGSYGSTQRGISPELLAILADPGDKGPVELVADSGKEWLVNRRNGFRYPVEDGIPIMLLEEGEKYKDENLISR